MKFKKKQNKKLSFQHENVFAPLFGKVKLIYKCNYVNFKTVSFIKNHELFTKGNCDLNFFSGFSGC